MRTKILLLVLFSVVISSITLARQKKINGKKKPIPAVKDSASVAAKPLVTFIELGSVNCIPCKAMQKVMKAVEEKYGSQIRILFYDVWKEEQKHYAEEYNIRLIPTQVFLDKNGKELMRHEGYFPEKDIDGFLQSKGLKPKSMQEK
jgi:thioredoxin 1